MVSNNNVLLYFPLRNLGIIHIINHKYREFITKDTYSRKRSPQKSPFFSAGAPLKRFFKKYLHYVITDLSYLLTETEISADYTTELIK